MKIDPMEKRLLAIVNALPGAYEDRPWGSVHCKVGGKIFVGWGRHDDGSTQGEMRVGFKTDKSLQAMLVASDSRFTIAKYVGKHGWVDMRVGEKPNWDELEQFIVDSYNRIAPKKLQKELEGQPAASRRHQSSEIKSATSTKATIAMAKPSRASTKQYGGRAPTAKKRP